MKVVDIILIPASIAAYICQIYGIQRDGLDPIWIFCFIGVTAGFIPAMYRTTRWVMRRFK